MRRKIVYTERDYLVFGGVTHVGGVWAHNLWYTTRGRDHVVRRRSGGNGWDDFVKTGREIGGVFADPQFVDVAKRDFTLKPDSPALKLGFRPFDVSKSGPVHGAKP